MAKARDWQPAFIEALRHSGNVSAAAELAGIDRTTAYKARDKSLDTQAQTFAQEWNAALDVATDALELEARRRALTGVDEPVYYQGDVVGHIKKYSDTLLIFMLKAHRPEKFRENVAVEHSGQLTVRTLADVAREVAGEGVEE